MMTTRNNTGTSHELTYEDVIGYIEGMGYEDVRVFSDPDYASAFLGVSSDGCSVYSYTGMINHLIEHDDMNADEAREFIDYNTFGTMGREGDPIVLMDEIPPQ